MVGGSIASAHYRGNRQGDGPIEAKMNRREAEAAEKRGYAEPPPELRELTQAVIGAAIEVHRHLGPGFLEAAYERALAIELELRKVPFQRQVQIPLSYKGLLVGEQRIDFLIDEQIILEIKSVEAFSQVHRAQLMAYLKAGALQLVLLINFNVHILKDGVRRVVWSR